MYDRETSHPSSTNDVSRLLFRCIVRHSSQFNHHTHHTISRAFGRVDRGRITGPTGPRAERQRRPTQSPSTWRIAVFEFATPWFLVAVCRSNDLASSPTEKPVDVRWIYFTAQVLVLYLDFCSLLEKSSVKKFYFLPVLKVLHNQVRIKHKSERERRMR